MAGPLLPLYGLGVVIGSAVGNFLASKAGGIIAGLGLAFVFYQGVSGVADALLIMVNSQVATAGAITMAVGNTSFPIGQWLIGAAKTAGFFDAVNVVVSAYFSRLSAAGLKMLIGMKAA